MANQQINGVIITATEAEAGPFITGLELKKTENAPFPVYEKDDLHLIVSGIGKANGAMAAAYACMNFSPAWILNPGAAGATKESANPGDTYQIIKILEPDRPHFRTNSAFIQTPDTLDGFPSAVLATQDRAVIDMDTFKELRLTADLVDMEGASILQTCKRFKVPCYVFKFISDTPAHCGEGPVIKEYIKKLSIPFSRHIIDSVIFRLKTEA